MRKNQEKEHYRDYNRRNTMKEIMNLDRVDFVNSSSNYILYHIIPFLLHRWKHQEREAKNLDPNDFISRLPVDILCRIISFLPFESAVQTSSLSTRWKGLWRKTLMDLVQDATLEDAVVTISKFFYEFSQLHRPRNNWGFQFDFGQVAIATNNTLHIDFSGGEQEFPWQVDWFLGLYLPLPTHQPSSYTLKVKALDLRSLSHLSSKAISSMVSNFPLLQSLTIAKCNDLESLHIKGAINLQKLTVLDCLRLESLEIKDSNLCSFKYRGKLVSFQFAAPLRWRFYTFQPEFHLEDAMLDFRQGPGHNCINPGFKSIFQSIEGVKSLTLCRWIFQIDPKCYNDVTSTKKFSPLLTGIKKLYDLKVVKLEGFADFNKEIFFAQCLRPLFKARSLIIAKSNGTWLRRLVKVLNLDKKAKYPYRFKIIKDVHDEICPNHVHMKPLNN